MRMYYYIIVYHMRMCLCVCICTGGAGPNEVGVAGMKSYDSQVAFH